MHFTSTRRVAMAAMMASLFATLPSSAEPVAIQLFRVIGARDEITIGLTQAEFDGLGSGAGVERVARKLVSDGQLTAWQYMVTRGPDGTTRYASTRRVAILRQDTLRIEPYAPALPVSLPPT